MWFKSRFTIQTVAAISFFIVGGTVPVAADILHVPGDFPTIQEAIDAALDGDEVEVHPGTYNETINFLGKAITLRSSDGPEVTTIDGTGNLHVVQCVSDEAPDTILDGFTITGGNAKGGFPDNRGGGMLNFGSSPTVINCTFSGNTAGIGGGMVIIFGSPTVTNCTFLENTAHSGGGLLNSIGSSPMISNCTFSGNTAQIAGGAILNSTGSPTISNCTFIANSANDYAGGIYNVDSNPAQTDCLFSENNSLFGGAMYNYQSSSTVTNCTFAANFAIAGGAIYNFSSSPTISNCMFITNSAKGVGGGMYNDDPSNPPISESVFCSNNPDHITGKWVDEGGNEFLDECHCPWDMHGDGLVGLGDLLILLGWWCCDPNGPPDFNGDGIVNTIDLLELFANWGPCP